MYVLENTSKHMDISGSIIKEDKEIIEYKRKLLNGVN